MFFYVILTGDNSEPSSEELLDQEVSKVEKVLSSLGNSPTWDVGNSVVEAQGKMQPHYVGFTT